MTKRSSPRRRALIERAQDADGVERHAVEAERAVDARHGFQPRGRALEAFAGGLVFLEPPFRFLGTGSEGAFVLADLVVEIVGAAAFEPAHVAARGLARAAPGGVGLLNVDELAPLFVGEFGGHAEDVPTF